MRRNVKVGEMEGCLRASVVWVRVFWLIFMGVVFVGSVRGREGDVG